MVKTVENATAADDVKATTWFTGIRLAVAIAVVLGGLFVKNIQTETKTQSQLKSIKQQLDTLVTQADLTLAEARREINNQGYKPVDLPAIFAVGGTQ